MPDSSSAVRRQFNWDSKMPPILQIGERLILSKIPFQPPQGNCSENVVLKFSAREKSKAEVRQICFKELWVVLAFFKEESKRGIGMCVLLQAGANESL